MGAKPYYQIPIPIALQVKEKYLIPQLCLMYGIKSAGSGIRWILGNPFIYTLFTTGYIDHKGISISKLDRNNDIWIC